MNRFILILLLFALSLSSHSQGLMKRRAFSAPAALAGGGPTTDNFNRADETPLAGNWTRVPGETGTINLSGNAVTPNSINFDTAYYYNAGSFGNDQYSQIKVTVSGAAAGAGLGVIVRASTSVDTYYRCVLDGAGNIEFGSVVASTFTFIAGRTVTYSAGAILKLDVTGTTFTITYNGTQAGATITDSSISTGKPGIAYSSVVTSASGDDWQAQ